MSIYKGNIKLTGTSLPSQTGQSGKFLSTNGVNAGWVDINMANASLSNLNATGENRVLPSQTDNENKFLTTNGTSPSWVSIGGTPTGTIIYFSKNIAPTGWLIADGSNISRVTYSDLFTVIGTTFGAGDGSTTFTLPNLINRFAEGSTTVGTYISAGLPDHSHTDVGVQTNISFEYGGGAMCSYAGTHTTGQTSISDTIYGASSTVQPPALTFLPCIKY